MKGGKYGTEGKGADGKGYKGNGTGNGKGVGYRSPVKAVGKGLNYYGQNDYWEAWGDDCYNYRCDGWNGDNGDYGYIGHIAMLLEKEGSEENKPEQTEQLTIVHDPLRNTSREKPIAISNAFQELQTDCDATRTATHRTGAN